VLRGREIVGKFSVLGVPERMLMSVMGWSSTAMAARYQHVTDPIWRDVADRIGGLLWGSGRVSTMPIETTIETMPVLLRQPYGSASAFPLVEVAEDAGFEPARA
jgi:hypothetical protein